ncbi:hypothetical protein YC2023_048215 [Brassica napus]
MDNVDRRQDHQWREDRSQSYRERQRSQRDGRYRGNKENYDQPSRSYVSRKMGTSDLETRREQSYHREGSYRSSNRREERWIETGRHLTPTERGTGSVEGRSRTLSAHSDKRSGDRGRTRTIEEAEGKQGSGSIGEVEETAENMARRMMNEQRVLRDAMEVDSPEAATTRTPAVLRLGDASLPTKVGENSNKQGRVSAKKRLGRPPLTRKPGTTKGKALAGTIKPRKVTMMKGSPKRKGGRQTVNSRKTGLVSQEIGVSTSRQPPVKPSTKTFPKLFGASF